MWDEIPPRVLLEVRNPWGDAKEADADRYELGACRLIAALKKRGYFLMPPVKNEDTKNAK